MKRFDTRCRLRANTPDGHPSRPRTAMAFAAFRRVLVCSALLGFAVGCVTKGTYDAVVEERDQLAKVRRDLEGRVELLEAANQSFDS